MSAGASREARLADLTAMSVDVGSDLALVQGPGGNTSVKHDGVLWVKASGAWLEHASDQPVFVPVELAAVMTAIEAGEEKLPPSATLPGGPDGLRPSIETTLHALMPHRFVAHTHAVNTMAQGSLGSVETVLAGALEGIAWAHVPYCRPGLPLTLKVREALRVGQVDVLILGNHGLVVGAETADEAVALTREVERRISLTPRESRTEPDRVALQSYVDEVRWRMPTEGVSHAVAFDPQALVLAQAGSLYPDHVIFLGHAVCVMGEAPEGAAVVVVPGAGVLLKADAPPAADWMVHALSEVTTRLSPDDDVRFLADSDEAALLNWDAEKYRQSLAKRRASSLSP